VGLAGALVSVLGVPWPVTLVGLSVAAWTARVATAERREARRPALERLEAAPQPAA
jgi:hypothetical protein